MRTPHIAATRGLPAIEADAVLADYRHALAQQRAYPALFMSPSRSLLGLGRLACTQASAEDGALAATQKLLQQGACGLIFGALPFDNQDAGQFWLPRTLLRGKRLLPPA